MERVLFSRVPLWVLIATIIVACFGMIGFGVLTYDAIAGKKRFGMVAEAAAFVAASPEQILQQLRSGHPMEVSDRGRLEGRAGWSVSGEGPRPDGYVLLSRYDGDAQRPVVELVSLATADTIYRWTVEIETLLEGAAVENVSARQLLTNEKFRTVHPLAAENGDIYVKNHLGPLVRMTPCGRTVWLRDWTNFHHSIEADADGNIWVPSHPGPTSFGDDFDFEEDSMVLVSPEGETLMEISVTRLLIDNGMLGALFPISHEFWAKDPTHLNDIQPVLEDGPFWKAGDVFVSLRSLAMVALVRPSTRELLWYRMGGPWASQHDVDIIDDHTISVFSNNSYDMGHGGFVEGSNDVFFYDFETDTVSKPLHDAMEAEHMQTIREGLADKTTDGFVLTEETDRGRVVVLRSDGSRYSEFVNRAENGKLYRMNWSRYLDAGTGAALAARLATVECDAG